VFIPGLFKPIAILRDYALKFGQLMFGKPPASRHRHRRQPKLRYCSIPLNVHMRWLQLAL
jgi:hypothetical protein